MEYVFRSESISSTLQPVQSINLGVEIPEHIDIIIEPQGSTQNTV